MTEKSNITSLVSNAIELSASAAYADFYFSPLFAKELPQLVPELEKAGFILRVIELEKEDGAHVKGEIIHKDGSRLFLGELVLTGEDVHVAQDAPLQPLANVIKFIQQRLQD